MQRVAFLVCAAFWPTAVSALTVDEVVQRFEGQYQGTVEGAKIGRPDDGTLLLHTFVRRIDAPSFGDDVVYMEQRYGGPEGQVSRQRVFSFAAENGSVVTTAYDFTEGAPYARSDAVPERLAPVKPNDLYSFPAGCRIRWSERDGIYVGAVSRQDCSIDSRFGWGKVFIDMIYRVSDDAYTLFEEGYNDSDKLLFGAPDAQTHRRLPSRNLDAQLARILSRFEGAFDIHHPQGTAVPDKMNVGKLYTKARRVDLPAFGPHVIYMEMARGGSDGKVEVQRILSFDDDQRRPANVMRSYNFSDGKAYAGAYQDPSKLASLRAEDVEQLDTGCETIWSEHYDVLTGSVEHTACHILNKNGELQYQVSLDYMLDGKSMHLWEHGYDPDGNFLFGTARPLVFPRVQTSW